MKLQHLAVIFIIIIMPLTLIMSGYIQNQIDTIKLQTQCNTSLTNATYDALKAFQINSINNKYSSISDSKIRDIEASISTFYNSITTSMSKYGNSKEEISVFVPAILFTLYDGYYINSTYNNIYSTTLEGKVQLNDDGKNYQTGLRPYIYYSCTYNLNDKKIVVNYTLDNAITVYGDFGSGYETRSGHLIDYTKVKGIEDDLNGRGDNKLTYDDVEIVPETLTEHLLIVTDDSDTPVAEDYEYIVYKNKKVYYDRSVSAGQTPYFWYDNYKKTYLQSEAIELEEYLNNNGVGFKSISAFEYYYEAYNFSKWVVEKLGNITQTNMDSSYMNGLSVNTGTAKIFDTTQNTTQFGENDPMLSSSVFNTHRMAIIRKSIETNLMTAIANYNVQNESNYEFSLPVVDEENWYKITNNISIISFMQGIPIGQKYYNNYSVITNTRNEETINENSIYIVTTEGNNIEYHKPGCKKLIDEKQSNISGSYTSLSFLRQTAKISEFNIHYFYPQSRKGKLMTACYNCVVNATGDYDIDSIIRGQIKEAQTDQVLYNEEEIRNVRKTYFTALARERYDLYRTSKF